MRLWILAFAGFVLAVPLSALAQEAPAPEVKQESVTPAQDDATLEKRLELAKKMHEIRPSKDQVNAAIDVTAARLPQPEQEPFKSRMRSILNYRAIEKISIDAMASTFTVEELQAMVDCYGKPEAKSASDKMEAYQAIVGPELVKMIDQAMMRTRTGGN
jgi:hypothetical protein